MKAYIEFIGNEDRRPKTGERFEDENGSIVVACYDHEEIRRMVTRHEIEIPDGAKCLTIFPDSIITCPEASVAKIVIPRPKKKVKKWLWIVGINRNSFFANIEHRTEEEIKATLPSQDWYHRIDETMIEVEE